MATSIDLTNVPNIDMVFSTINVNTGPEFPNYRTVAAIIPNQAYSAISGSSTTTVTVTMPQLTANSLVLFNLNANAGLTSTIVKTPGTGFVITLAGTDKSAGTMDILVINPA